MSAVEKRQGRNKGDEKKDNVASLSLFSQSFDLGSDATPFSPIQTVSNERAGKVNHSLNCFCQDLWSQKCKVTNTCVFYIILFYLLKVLGQLKTQKGSYQKPYFIVHVVSIKFWEPSLTIQIYLRDFIIFLNFMTYVCVIRFIFKLASY